MVDQQNMKNKVLRDYAMPSIDRATTSIKRPVIQAAHFEIEAVIIQVILNTIQFNELACKDPNWHITNSLGICDTFKQTCVTNDVIRVKLVPFSLKDKAKVWINLLVPSIIYTWEELAQKFLAKYFLLAMMAKFRNHIIMFTQCKNESLYKAWERS